MKTTARMQLQWIVVVSLLMTALLAGGWQLATAQEPSVGWPAFLPFVAKQQATVTPLPPTLTPSPTVTLTPAPTATPWPTEPATATPTVTEAPTSTPTPTLTPACSAHQAALTLTASGSTCRVGQQLQITARLQNTGNCALLGLPRYRLSGPEGSWPELLEALGPLDVTHSLGLNPGESDEATFLVRAVAAGTVTLSATVSFEVHLGYPGPAYWSSAASEPLTITVSGG